MREQQPLSLLMVDVDYFKRYNDAYGHAQGDICLRAVAQAASGVLLRSSDLAARYGGEELAVLLPNTDLEGAAVVAQRIHAGLAKAALPFAASPVASHVTVSVGVATLVPDGDSATAQLVAYADEALYAAKSAGRNRTHLMLDPASLVWRPKGRVVTLLGTCRDPVVYDDSPSSVREA